MKITALKGQARKNAIEAARVELKEAFHFKTRTATDSLIEEMANDYFFRFDNNGKMY